MRVSADDGAHLPACGLPQALHMSLISRAGIDHDETCCSVAHQVAVGARPGHEAGVGRRQPLHIAQQGHGLFVLPANFVLALPIGADQRQLAKGQLVFHEARNPSLPAGRARAARPQRSLACASGQHGGHVGLAPEPFQCFQRGKHERQAACGMPGQRGAGRQPLGVELLLSIRLGTLPRWHAGHEMGHVITAWPVAARDPARQQKQLARCQFQPSRLALGRQRGVALQPGHVLRYGRQAVRAAGQQHAHFFKGFAQGSQRGCQRMPPLAGAGGSGQTGIVCIHAAARKNVGAGREPRLGGALREQHLKALRAVAQQKQAGRSLRLGRRAGRIQKLAGAGHDDFFSIIGAGSGGMAAWADQAYSWKGQGSFIF